MALSPLGWLYGMATLARMRQGSQTLAVPVICFGNPTLGGSGKTPLVRLAASLLREAGRRPAVLLRGYGGRQAGPLVVDGQNAADVGDEALLHASDGSLTVIARDRFAGGTLAMEHGADIILMDDGFQNPSLSKTASFLVVDGQIGLGNGLVFPAGPLRAPFDAQMKQASALIMMGRGEAGERLSAQSQGRPVIRAELAPDQAVLSRLKDGKLIAFCGIGRPEKFVTTLRAGGASSVELVPFPDHHSYQDSDAERLLTLAKAQGARLVTTEKDAVKLKGSSALERLREAAIILHVQARITEGEAAFRDLIGLYVS